MICMLIPAGVRLENPLPISGHRSYLNVTLPNSGPAFATASFYNSIWNFAGTEGRLENQIDSRNFYNIDDYSPPLGWMGLTFYWHHVKQGWFWIRQETGPKKHGTQYEGCRALWDGRLLAPDWETGKFMNCDSLPLPFV